MIRLAAGVAKARVEEGKKKRSIFMVTFFIHRSHVLAVEKEIGTPGYLHCKSRILALQTSDTCIAFPVVARMYALASGKEQN